MDEIIVKIPGGKLRVIPWAPDQVRVTFTAQEDFCSGSAPLVLPESKSMVRFSVEESADRTRIVLPALVVEMEPSTGKLSYWKPDGQLLMKEPPRGGKMLDPFDVIRYDYENTAGPDFEWGADGFKARTAKGTPRVDRRAWHAKLSFSFQAGEALYGLGSHEESILNLRGTVQYLYQQNRKIAVPYLVSSRGWSVLWNTGSTLTFRDDQFGSSMWIDCVDELDFWVTASASPNDSAAALRRLTGFPPLLPRWAFGYIQSKERYKTQEEILEIAREFRRRQLPLHCLVLDWMSWPEGLWGQKSLDPSRFPDPSAMIRELHDLGIKFMVSIWPILRSGGSDHREFAEHNLLLGNGSNYNAFDPDARDLFWRQAELGLFRHGVDAWWGDCTEPFEADWHGATQPEPEERRAINLEEFHKYLDPSVANLFSSFHSEGLYTHQRSVTESKRVVNLTRSSYPGQQRWSTIAWSGDFSATWEDYRSQIPAALNFCATGMPWWTFDIGAFFVKNDPEQWFWAGDYDQGAADPGYRELYLRMFQFGAFLPMFRSHGTDTPREPWHFGAPGDAVYDSLVCFLRLRERLLPWIYSQAADVCFGTRNLVRPVAFDYINDPRTHDLKDQYLFGEGLLVCPVIQSLATAGPQRSVYLPKGLWYDFWTGDSLVGGRTIEAEAGLDRMPLFVKAGTILVLESPSELRVYPGADGRLDLYDDAGDGYGYENGESCRIPIRWSVAAETLTLDAVQGSFPSGETAKTFTCTAPNGTPWGSAEFHGVQIQIPWKA